MSIEDHTEKILAKRRLRGLMKAVIVSEFQEDLDKLVVSSRQKPVPGPDQLLIEVRCAGLNFVDILYARGQHQNNKSGLVIPPFICGLEFSGIVASNTSTKFPAGTRVFGSCSGSFATHILVKESNLFRMPDGMDYAAAGTLGATISVSHYSLVRCGGLRRGANQTVLIHGAAGGLGLAAVQIAKAYGATVIATGGNDEKLKIVKEKYGADVVINYETHKDWEKLVNEATKKGPGKNVGLDKFLKGSVDIVFDPLGMINKSISTLAFGGKLLVIGFAATAGKIEAIKTNRILLKEAKLIGVRYGEGCRRDPTIEPETWDDCLRLMNEGHIKSMVGKEWEGLENVPNALKDLEQRKVCGKIAVRVSRDIESASL